MSIKSPTTQVASSTAQPLTAFEDGGEDVLLAVTPYVVFGLLLLVAAAGAVTVAIMQPTWVDALLSSFTGAEPKAYWYLARASGLVAFGLIWLSMVLGLAITNKLARAWPGGPTVVALHNFTSLLGLGFGMFHGLILTGDRYTNYTLVQVLIPFASVNYRPLWVGLGQVGLYLAALIGLSFYVRRWIRYNVWRVLHFLSFGIFLLTLVHGLMSGTDSTGMLLRDIYWACGVSVVGLILYRIAQAREKKAMARSS